MDSNLRLISAAFPAGEVAPPRVSDTMDIKATVLFLSLAVAVLSADSVGSKAQSCADVRQFYSGKGFTLHGVPQTEISGEI